MMWHWLMRCHNSIRLKFLCTVDQWRGSMSVDQKSCVRYMHIHGIIYNQITSLFKPHDYSNRVVKPCHYSNRVVKPCHYSNYVVKPRIVDWWRGTILTSKMFLIRWPWFTQCIYKKGVSPPNLASFNSFLSSIFCNSFSILYFLRILINFHFTSSWIMGS